MTVANVSGMWSWGVGCWVLVAGENSTKAHNEAAQARGSSRSGAFLWRIGVKTSDTLEQEQVKIQQHYLTHHDDFVKGGERAKVKVIVIGGSVERWSGMRRCPYNCGVGRGPSERGRAQPWG